MENCIEYLFIDVIEDVTTGCCKVRVNGRAWSMKRYEFTYNMSTTKHDHDFLYD